MSEDKKGPAGKRTVVEEGTTISGNLSSTCPIVVLGAFDGEISGPSMEIAATGQVSGRVKVTALRSCGEVAGEVEAETVELSGRVRDETVIRARTLEVGSTTGAPVKFGECELSIGDQPDKQRAIDEATGVAGKREVAPPGPKRRRTGAVDVPLEVTGSGRVPV